MNTGDTAFVMISTALVFFMTPGLAFFYGGLVRRKNVGNTMMECARLLWGFRLSCGFYLGIHSHLVEIMQV